MYSALSVLFLKVTSQWEIHTQSRKIAGHTNGINRKKYIIDLFYLEIEKFIYY